MKKVICFIFLCLVLQADENIELFEKAQLLEKKGNYKEAMLIYKELALQKNPIEQVEHHNHERSSFFKNQISFDDMETASTVEQIISSEFDLYAYKTNYFAPISYTNKKEEDRKKIETKFQISIRKPIAYNILGFNESIELAYTQTSWWQIYEKSSPFRENNYNPEIFALFLNKNSNSTLKAAKIGFIHSSNGEKGELSRSWNRVYLQGTYRFADLFIQPTIWYRIPEKSKQDEYDPYGDDNPDILKYYGHGELSFIYPYKKNIFTLNVRNNFRKSNKGFMELTWTYPLDNNSRFSKYFGYVSLSSGYGDGLTEYKENIKRATIGIAFSR
ncbi:MAG: phospholipase A [Arcobacteraceae bacterium]|jgi:phospholipase A1|nr:phospholipase A [Arcobacteraceae bacterium]MDY0365461.1 phospholipase A [Arcobacteraceae bacterium]